MGLFDRFKSGLKKTAQQLTVNLEGLFKGGAVLPASLSGELEDRLIASDMGVELSKTLVREVADRVAKEGSVPVEAAKQFLRQALLQRFEKIKGPSSLARPVIVLMVGVNGAGKTTTTGKLATHWAQEGRKILLVAGDTFRAAAEEQLTMWAERAKVEILRAAHGAAPSAVVFDGLKSGIARGFDCLLVDTAGRLHNRQNLMEELRKVARVAEKAAPGVSQEKWLVLDANTGQNALSQAREFHRDLGLTGLILTKMDGTAKGGIVVALAHELALPVRFLGVGEGADDLVPFDPELFVRALVPEEA